MSLPALAVRRPIGVAMCAIAVVGIGLVSVARLPIDLLPDLMYPELVVRVADAGVAPTEVERSVTDPVEGALATLPGLERIESTVRAGMSTTSLRFAWGTRMDYAALAVRERLDAVRGALPPSAARPTLLRADPSSEPVLTVVVTRADADDVPRPSSPVALGDRARVAALHELGAFADDVVRRRLEQLDGVAEATVVGAPAREIRVDVDAEHLASPGVTVDDVARALDDANQSAPGGTVQRAGVSFALRTIGELAGAEEIGDVVVRTTSRVAGGASAAPSPALRVRDVARVLDAFEQPTSLARVDGRDAVALLVRKEPAANTVQVARRVASVLRELRAEHPSVRVSLASSQAGFVGGAIATVAQEVVVGGALAFVVLFLFLRDTRVPVAIGVVVPVSLLAACALLDAAGLSLNVMTLGGLALGVGLLMDNSIVVAESVLRRRAGGLSSGAAAVAGAEEVQGAVATSTLTTIAVFAPVAYVAGVPGRLFGALALSIAFALGVSALVALTVVPAMAARWSWPSRVRAGAAARVLAAFERGFEAFAALYERVLVAALRRRAWVASGAALLLALTVAGLLALDRAVLPDVDQGAFRVRLAMPPGTPLDATAVAAARLDAELRADPRVSTVLLRAGEATAARDGLGDARSGSAHGELHVRVHDGAAGAPAIARLRAALRSGAVADLAAAVVVEERGGSPLGALLGADDADLVVRIRGDDLDAAHAYARTLSLALAREPSLVDVRVAGVDRQPEVQVEIDRERAAEHAVDARRIAHVVEAAGRGVVATRLVGFDRTVPIVVRSTDARERTLAGVRAIDVDGVPLRELATVRERPGPSAIRREGRGRVTDVLADVGVASPGGLAGAIAAAEAVVARHAPPSGMTADVGGRREEMRRGFSALALAFGLAVALVYLILAAEFESLVHPLTVLLSVPLALTGAVVALWVTRTPLSAVSAIGLVVLVGIVDNDAVVKVDCVVRLRREGLSARDAVLAAGRRRLRPIVINTVTALLGLLPMALGIGAGAELQAPLAIALFGGLLSATLLTLVVIPVVYTLLEDARVRVCGASGVRARDVRA